MTHEVDAAALLEAMSEGMYVVDRTRTITHWNPAAERISGYTAEQAVGRWCGDGMLNHVDENGAVLCGTRCPLRAVMHDGRSRTVHAYLHHDDGHLVPVSIAASPVRDGEGRIVGAVETFREDGERSSTLARLREAERQASTDALTGIGNRRFFDAGMRRRLGDWERSGRGFGVLVVDLDRFKAINDACGHPVGDAVLRTVARSLGTCVRAGDEVARFGGEEFVVMADADSAEALRPLADRIRMVIRQGRYPGTEGLPVTASVGAALVEPGDTPASLLGRADEALFAAKAAGRNATVMATAH